MEFLDISSCELAGTNLIEASAGTGKTYTIAALFLRLIVEKDLAPDKILVVTFTRAAVEELRARLYRVLQDARECFLRRDFPAADFIRIIRKDPAQTLEEKLGRVTRALRDFDECAVFTIHGFCQRMLLENVFSGATRYDTELISDQAELLLEALRDFWRSHIYPAPECVMAHFLQNGLELFAGLYKFRERNPDLRVAAPPGQTNGRELTASFARLKKACAQLKAARPAAPADTIAWFELERKILDGRSYKKNYIKSAARVIHEFCRSSDPVIDAKTREKLGKFTSTELREKSKNGEIPDHEFFRLADEVARQYDEFTKLKERYLLHLKARMFDYVFDRLSKRKKKDNVQSFNDLITSLRQSLAGPRGGRLGRAIRRRFSVALIDEFQDTDPGQYAIFNTLFSSAALFLIGDPKQAIYSFRGADVYAYLQAASRVEHRYTLATNYRSDQGLVRAVNGLFGREMTAVPFAEKDIAFQPVKAAITDSSLIIEDKKSDPALTIWTIDSAIYEGEKITGGKVRPLINQAVTAEIHRLLSLAGEGRATIGHNGETRPLRPADFAVLTRSRKDMIPLQSMLVRAGIPCVTSSAADIFDSAEAREMELLLQALARPGNEGALKAALAQPLFGLDGRNLQELAADPFIRERWALAFQHYQELFRESGFLGMFRVILREEKIKERLPGLAGGERHLVNILHLAEIIQERQEANGAGLNELLNWFSGCRADSLRREEEFELRMESDDNAVRLITIHKSKGLEYPIVFAPFVWGGSEPGARLCHDEEGRMTLYLDREQFAARRTAAFRESMSENLRLFYVALTRARHRCYTFWTKFTSHARTHTSAPAYLFLDGGRVIDSPDPPGELKKAYDELADVDALKDYLEERLGHVREYVAVAPLPGQDGLPPLLPESDRPKLEAAVFPGSIPPAWQIASFSRLTGEAHQAAPGRRFTDEPAQIMADEFTIFTFPRGARPGTFMHELLEHLDFTGSLGGRLEKTITAALEKYGFAPEFAPAVRQMLENVVSQPLDGFTLSLVPEDRRLNEMEFYFPLKKITPAELAAVFGGAVSADSVNDLFSRETSRLTFSPLHGYMHGFIDLVFAHQSRYYLIDWKSNYLGGRTEDYGPEAINRAMSENFYFLQYHIYTLALHLYLGSRLPDYDYDRDFGGVCYLFLRGLAPPGATGVYFHKPARLLIDRLCGLVARGRRK